MTVIKSYIWMLINNQVGDLAKEQIKYLKVAYRSTDHLIALINDMLNISRMDQGKLTFKCKEEKVIRSVSSAIAEYDLKAKEKKIYLERDFSKVPPDITAYYDEDRLKECVVNLVSNAIKFTKEGGATVTIEEDGDFVKIIVTDTGVGISEDDAKSLFKKFGKVENSYRKSEVTGGTGLGLYIVKIYAEAMGGQIGYTSQGDFKGSTFWLTVPKSLKIY
jgi:signal transduction histidine kinase